MENLQQIYDDTGRPGASVFRNAARRKGVYITQAEARDFVAGQSVGQVAQQRLPSDGKVTAAKEDSRWQLDLLDFSKRRQQPGGHKYVLTVVDVFSRYLWAERMVEKTPQAALSAYRKVISQNNNKHPREVSSDLGQEFSGVFAAYLQKKGTADRKKDPQSINSIAVVDRAQQKLRSILAGLQASSDAHWSTLLKKSVSLYNDGEHASLYGESPEGVTENEEVQYLLTAQAGKDIKHNNDRWRAKAGRLTDKGGFRVPLPRATWAKIDAPKFDGEVHQVASLKGANVQDTQGNSYPVRKVLAVPADSADISVNPELSAGSGRKEQQRSQLRRYSEMLKQELSGTGEMTLTRVRDFLKSRPGFEDNAALVRLPSAGRYVASLRLYGYRISGAGPTLVVRAPAAAVGRAAVREVAAPIERAQRRDLPGTQAIRIKPDNPKRGGTLAYARYELYKSSATVGEARTAGMTPQDLRDGIARGQIELI